jgi:hypothetical protein
VRCARPVAALLILLVSGCATHLSTARDYAASGKHELAAGYLGGHYRANRSPEIKAELVQSIENAVGLLEARYQDLIGQGLAMAALGAATRLEGLLDYARSLDLGEFAAYDSGRLVKKAMSLALRRAVQAVDRAEADARPAREQTALLRSALALDPHNPELAERYERVRSSLKLNLALTADCRGGHREACREFLNRLTTRLSEERREFTQLVDPDSKIKNAELSAVVTVTTGDSDWRRTGSGRTEGEIEVKNKYRETELDSDGNKVYQKVQARYQVFERIAQAGVSVSVQVRDLRPPGRLLFEDSRRLEVTDRRRYLTWEGDPRALGDLYRIGTDQTPPKDPEELARIAASDLADRVFKQALVKLEGAAK